MQDVGYAHYGVAVTLSVHSVRPQSHEVTRGPGNSMVRSTNTRLHDHSHIPNCRSFLVRSLLHKPCIERSKKWLFRSHSSRTLSRCALCTLLLYMIVRPHPTRKSPRTWSSHWFKCKSYTFQTVHYIWCLVYKLLCPRSLAALVKLKSSVTMPILKFTIAVSHGNKILSGMTVSSYVNLVIDEMCTEGFGRGIRSH